MLSDVNIMLLLCALQSKSDTTFFMVLGAFSSSEQDLPLVFVFVAVGWRQD